jgi:nitrite reductase/ring-hydroxylating ferredoxin subunit/uncharacterized membrane protein
MTVDVVPDVTRVMSALSPEQNQTLDEWAGKVQGILNAAVSQGGPTGRRVKDWLNGVWLGHALHPALTDVAIGAWSTGFMLDVVGAKREADAAITVGVLSAIPTAMSGAADFADTSEEPRRIALIHGLLNATGLVCMLGSLLARRGDRRTLGFGLSTFGLGLASVSAWLGGELVYRLGTSVSRVAFEPRVEDFQSVARADMLQDGKLTPAEANVDGTKLALVLLKRGSTVMALSGSCPHWGGPLAEGKLIDGDGVQPIVECPWHASRFRFSDGAACQGPAASAANVYEARIRDGNVEVRRPA